MVCDSEKWEGNNVVSHGASEVLKDRLFTQSDIFRVPVCEKCGILAENRKIRGQFHKNRGEMPNSFYCRNCDSTEHVVDTFLPYGKYSYFLFFYFIHTNSFHHSFQIASARDIQFTYCTEIGVFIKMCNPLVLLNKVVLRFHRPQKKNVTNLFPFSTAAKRILQKYAERKSEKADMTQ